MSRAEPLPPPLTIWIVNPFDDIPGEGLPPLRYWSLARILAARGHDIGEIDGALGDRSRAAIKQEQARLGQEATGRGGQKVLRALRAEAATEPRPASR